MRAELALRAWLNAWAARRSLEPNWLYRLPWVSPAASVRASTPTPDRPCSRNKRAASVRIRTRFSAAFSFETRMTPTFPVARKQDLTLLVTIAINVNHDDRH